MITSTSNRQVKLLIQLNKKKRARDESGLFIAEGVKMFREAPKEQIERVYFSESYIESHRDEPDMGGILYDVMSDNVFRAVCDTQTPQGVLTVARRREAEIKEMIAERSPLVVLLENIQDPGNLGTILRTAEGAGVTGVIMSKGCVDLYNPKTIRSTMGSIYRVPVLTDADPLAATHEIKAHGILCFAAHLDGGVLYDRADYCGPSAFLIGNESAGLTDELAGHADGLIRIPMAGRVESLNASVAASILMYEAFRQRRCAAEIRC